MTDRDFLHRAQLSETPDTDPRDDGPDRVAVVTHPMHGPIGVFDDFDSYERWLEYSHDYDGTLLDTWDCVVRSLP